MELIDIHMRLTPSQLFELSALVQKWQDHERGVVVKRKVPETVLADYKKPEPKKPETWPERFKLIMAGIEAFRLKNDWPVKFFCEEKIKLQPANYYTMRSGSRVISEVTAKKLATLLGYTLGELEEEGRNTIYGTKDMGKSLGTGLPAFSVGRA